MRLILQTLNCKWNNFGDNANNCKIASALRQLRDGYQCQWICSAKRANRGEWVPQCCTGHASDAGSYEISARQRYFWKVVRLQSNLIAFFLNPGSLCVQVSWQWIQKRISTYWNRSGSLYIHASMVRLEAPVSNTSLWTSGSPTECYLDCTTGCGTTSTRANRAQIMKSITKATWRKLR